MSQTIFQLKKNISNRQKKNHRGLISVAFLSILVIFMCRIEVYTKNNLNNFSKILN